MQLRQRSSWTERPLWQFIRLFTWTSAIAIAFIAVSNVLIGATLWYEVFVNLPLMFGQLIVFVGVFTPIVWLRFRRLFQVYQSGQAADAMFTAPERQRWYVVATRYPLRIFIGFLGFAVGMSFAYHLADWAALRANGNGYAWDWSAFLQEFSFEQSLAWMLALLIYNGSRRIFRPILSWLSQQGHLTIPYRVSVQRRIVIFAIAIAIIISSQYINVGLSMPGGNRYVWSFLGLALVFVLLAIWCARMVIRDTVSDIDVVRDSLTAFNELDFPHSIQRLDVESADEVGDLKLEFNALQDKAERYYKDVSSQLELAYRVQVGLLPRQPLLSIPFVIRGSSLPATDLGGDFYDYLQVDDDTIAVLIGDVSGKGLPAALVTGMVLGLFRSEVRYGGSASDILHRMNDVICTALTAEMYVSTGLLLLQRATRAYAYASAGHVPPLYLRSARCATQGDQSRVETREWELSSMPLGIAAGLTFPEQAGRLEWDDAVVLYTDGLLEARLLEGREMVGFDRMRTWVERAALSGDANGCRFIERIVEAECGPREDDQTLVWIQVSSDLRAASSDEHRVGNGLVSKDV